MVRKERKDSSESGICTPADVKSVKAIGADAVLIGSALLLADNLEGMYRKISAV